MHARTLTGLPALRRMLAPFDVARLAAWELPVTPARLCEGVAPEDEYLVARVQQLCVRE